MKTIMTTDLINELADKVELTDEDADALVGLTSLMERHNLIGIRTFDNKWVVDARVADTSGNYRCRPQLSPWRALQCAIAGRDHKQDSEAGKRALREIAHTGLVTKEDFEWALSRYDENGKFIR